MMKIEAVLEQIKVECCVSWITQGNWNMHDLLIGILLITGPADVYLSSYSLSEHPAAIVADLKKKKRIRDLYCIIDRKIDKRCQVALNTLTSCANKYKLADVHAKITLIENEKMRIAVIGSANYTSVKTNEAGVIIGTSAVVDFHKNWMQNELGK